MAPSATVDALANALVARFLRTNDHAETLKAFIREAGLAPDVGQTSGDDTNNWTIQSLLEEKQTYDKSVSFEKYGEGSQETGLWSEPGELFFALQSSRVWIQMLYFVLLLMMSSAVKTCCDSDTDLIKSACCVCRTMAETLR
jgi:hypothetical protein